MGKFYKRFSETDGENRYVLGIKPLVFFGINPSTATTEKDDPTINKIKIFSEKNNYGAWIMLNIYPEIESDPGKLPKNMDEIVHKNNINHIKKYIDDDTVIIAAWGDAIDDYEHPYLKNCLKEIVIEIDGINKKWYSIGKLTANGNPRHPLFLNTDENLLEFKIEHYIASLKY